MGWWKTAKPGDKVVCVNAFSPVLMRDMNLVEGRVYELTGVASSDGWNVHGKLDCHVVVSLLGVSNPHSPNGFDARRFRPVQTKSTDTGMAMIKRILERPEQHIEEDA